MIDAHGREITYLRISVTDRCNFRCRYCMPADGIKLLQHNDIVTFDEILSVVRAAVGIGITRIRLTGGEPLIRRGIVDLVGQLNAVKEIEEIAMTTNGVRLVEFAEPLAEAGLKRVNISLDSMDENRFREITLGGELADVLAGIDAAEKAKLHPIKLNCVVGDNSLPGDPESVRQFAAERGYGFRIIHWMQFDTGRFTEVQGGSGGDCPKCNRLRLSSEGMVRPCLFSDQTFSIRDMEPIEAIRRAIAAKPKSGSPCTHNWMHGIGG